MRLALFRCGVILWPLSMMIGCDYFKEAPAFNEAAQNIQDERANKAAVASPPSGNAAPTERTSTKHYNAVKLTILNRMGPIKNWYVSTIRDGKEDEKIIKAKESGQYDKTIIESISHKQLLLKFFSRLPRAIAGLRLLEPTPEQCDFYSETPYESEEFLKIMNAFSEADEKTTDQDADGKPRDWYRYSELSFGIVDGEVNVVRVHLSRKETDWENLYKR